MTYNDFDFFYNQIIQKFYEELQVIDKKSFGGKAIKLNSKRKKLIYHYYEDFRKDIRSMYMREEKKPMDRHKIASNMMCSILKSGIILVNRKIPKLPIELLLANEYVAFYSAINILELYKQDKINDNSYSIILPDTYINANNENAYVENVCKALYYTKNFHISEIFAYANVLFMLEKYTDTKLKLNDNNLQKSIKEQEN